MDGVVELGNLIKDHTCEVRLQRAPSYIQPFLNEPVGENILLVYKRLVTMNVTTNEISVQDCSADSELLGSPLAYPFSPGDYDDDTVIGGPRKQWQKDEENHGSLSIIKARKILSLCNLYAQYQKVPVWVVCDGSDPRQTILLSSFHDRKSGWVTRNTVRFLGHWSYKQAEEYTVKAREEHLSISKISGCEVRTLISRVYDICQSSYDRYAQCNVSVRLSWSSPFLNTPPPVSADAVLEMLIVVEQPSSAAYKLWKQLKLLHQLVALLAVSRGVTGCVELPRLEWDDGNSTRTETTDVMNLFHETDYFAVKYQGTTRSAEEPATTMHLNLSVQEAVSNKLALYLDFVHHLFLLLANCRDSENLSKCFWLVFQQIQSGDAKIFVHPRNPTKVAHILRELMRGSSSLPALSGIRLVELLLEIGLEKLSKDYTHIFLSSKLATLEQLKLPSCDVNDLNDVRKKLDVLGRLQVVLDILLLAESQIKFSVGSLQSLAAFSLNNIETQVGSFSQLLELGHIRFQAPVNTREVKSLLPRKYSSSCMQLTSERENYKICTILHCSALPLFPFLSPDISDSQLCDVSGLEEDLHCSQLTCLSNKLF